MSDVEMPSCQEVVELVTDYLEGALPDSDRRRFEEHLDGCPHCRAYLEQLRVVIRAAGSITVDDLTPEVEASLLDAFRGWSATARGLP